MAKTQTLGVRAGDVLLWEATPLTRMTLKINRADPDALAEINTKYGEKVRAGDILASSNLYQWVVPGVSDSYLLSNWLSRGHLFALTDEDDDGVVVVQTRNSVISLNYLTLAQITRQTGSGFESAQNALQALAGYGDQYGIFYVGVPAETAA